LTAQGTRYVKDSLSTSNAALERRQIVLYCLPDDRGVNALVVVAQDVANAGKVLPADILMLRFQIAAEMAAGFRNNFYSTLDRGAQQPRALVVTDRLASKRFVDATNCFKHIADAQQRRSRDHSENPRRLGLNLLP